MIARQRVDQRRILRPYLVNERRKVLAAFVRQPRVVDVAKMNQHIRLEVVRDLPQQHQRVVHAGAPIADDGDGRLVAEAILHDELTDVVAVRNVGLRAAAMHEPLILGVALGPEGIAHGVLELVL